MKDFLSNRVNYYKSYASAMQSIFMQMRFGMKVCSSEKDIDLISIRKELSDYQTHDDCGLESRLEVDAGNNVSVSLPTTTGSLTGAVLPEDVTLETILWTQVSGPNTAVIVTPDELETDLAGLVEGTYVFNLSVTSSLSVTKTDTVTVEVKYVLPIANAGPDITTQVNTGILSTTDTPGSYAIASTTWEKVGGPSAGNISPTGTYYDLVPGIYTFKKTVMDINGRTDSDEMKLVLLASDIVVNYGWSSTDPYLSITSGNPFSFQKTVTIVDGADIVMDFHDMPPFSYVVVEVPTSQDIKNYYVDSGSAFNEDYIPGDHFRPSFVVNNKRYYVSYGTESFSSGISDRVTFKKI
jgi:hypothetical protein